MPEEGVEGELSLLSTSKPSLFSQGTGRAIA